MSVSIDQVKALRDETGVSIMVCRKALEEAQGDIEKAKVILRKHSKLAAEKKADRALSAGTIGVYVHAGGEVAAMVHLACETDFVAKNEVFQTLARDIAMHIAAMAPVAARREDVAQDERQAALAVFQEEAAGKPDDVREKVVNGKMDSWYRERVLLEQPFVKDESRTIGDLLNEATQKFGERIDAVAFKRFSVR
ncbi:elongation factor Ts [Candidatus Parcubacteria bacterium]|nr:MAG: elongation factor Ts [Candidatus Parcubacteria bacterium]GIW69146.1 MAG: elongation factor Ts [Candidatus Parcubacteria bacterium]